MTLIEDRPLYRPLELAFRTQYAEVRERSRAAGKLLPRHTGNPGAAQRHRLRLLVSPVLRGTKSAGRRPGVQGRRRIGIGRHANSHRFSTWTQQQGRTLRKLGFQVADKDVARVLVELHNKGLFAGGLLIVGTLAYMAWLNELGASAISSRTQDGAQCIPVKLPSPERFVWHKLYSSASRRKDPSKALKDALQAATLAAVLVEQDDASLEDSPEKHPRPSFLPRVPDCRNCARAWQPIPKRWISSSRC